MQIGVLALQGDFAAHARQIERCGAKTRLVTLPRHLEGLKGLVMPGGESTALLKLMAPHEMLSAILHFVKAGGGLLATCAGMILAAKQVTPAQASLQVIDIDVLRNAYGRQLDSQIVMGRLNTAYFSKSSCEMVFIRAPLITRVGPEVKILATLDQQPVMVQQNKVIALAFHPEMTADTCIHEYFLNSLC